MFVCLSVCLSAPVLQRHVLNKMLSLYAVTAEDSSADIRVNINNFGDRLTFRQVSAILLRPSDSDFFVRDFFCMSYFSLTGETQAACD